MAQSSDRPRRAAAALRFRIGPTLFSRVVLGAGGERCLAMRRGGGDEDDAVAGFQAAVAVDDQRGVERPAAMRLGLDLGELLLGHAGIVFEGQRGPRVAPADVAHQPDKARHPADMVVAAAQPIEFGTDVEILPLHPDHRYPPVTGGNTATSSLSASGWS